MKSLTKTFNDVDIPLDRLLTYYYGKQMLPQEEISLIEQTLEKSPLYVELLNGIDLMQQDFSLKDKDEFDSFLTALHIPFHTLRQTCHEKKVPEPK